MIRHLFLNNTNKTRIAWVDNVKMIAILFVILGHTWRIIHCPMPEWLGLFIISFNMALFVMMTGFTSVRSIDSIDSLNTLWNYVYKITKRILMPATVFMGFTSLAVILTKYLVEGDLRINSLFFWSILLPIYVVAFQFRETRFGERLFFIMCLLSIPISLKLPFLWFCPMLWCVCVAVAIGSYLKHRIGIHTFIFALLISLILDFLHDKTSDFIWFFLLGYALSKYELLKNIEHPLLSFAYIVLGLFIVNYIGYEGMNFWGRHFLDFFNNHTTYIYFLRILASVLICLFFICVTKIISREYNQFSQWGALSLAIYMIHSLIINIFNVLPIHYGISDTIYLFYAIPVTIIITIATMILIKFFMRYDITRAYCLGEFR